MYILDLIFIAVIGTLVGFLIGMSGKPKNNVHFYVTCELNHRGEIIYTLWIGEPYCTEDKGFISDAWSSMLAVNESFVLYNLNYSDFKDMKIGEIKEVFINL